jgi:hypothetical protein
VENNGRGVNKHHRAIFRIIYEVMHHSMPNASFSAVSQQIMFAGSSEAVFYPLNSF